MTISDALRIEGLTFAYATQRSLIEDLSLVVQQREIVGVMGPSGCGKSTLLKIISGFLAPQAGRISVSGRDVLATPPRARSTSMVFQQYALFPQMSSAENIEFGLRVRRAPPKARKERVSELIRLLKLEAVEHTRADRLSGGQQQRVALARSLAVQPSTLLLDEPFSAVDEQVRDEVRTLVAETLNRERASGVLVSHSLEDATHVCDRICFWEGARLTEPRAMEEWIADPVTSGIARSIGYVNVLPASWWAVHAGDNGGSGGSSPTRAVVVPDRAITLLAPSSGAGVCQPGSVRVQGEIRGVRWRGANRRALVEVSGETLEVPLPEGRPPASFVTAVIDASRVLGLKG